MKKRSRASRDSQVAAAELVLKVAERERDQPAALMAAKEVREENCGNHRLHEQFQGLGHGNSMTLATSRSTGAGLREKLVALKLGRGGQ